MHDDGGIPNELSAWLVEVMQQDIFRAQLAEIDRIGAEYEEALYRVENTLIPDQSAYVPGAGAFSWFTPMPTARVEQLVLL